MLQYLDKSHRTYVIQVLEGGGRLGGSSAGMRERTMSLRLKGGTGSREGKSFDLCRKGNRNTSSE